ncbi:MAG: response regulator [Epsilonproteobacteria bacterium]|nr:response regulator [Campylobacterota bacterium]
MRIVLGLLIIFFYVSIVEAEYIRSIRLGSYVGEKAARKAYEKLELFVQQHPRIQQLQQKDSFIFKYRPSSGNYYLLLAEPFTKREVLTEVLHILQKKYPDAYVKRLQSLPKDSFVMQQKQQPSVQEIPMAALTQLDQVQQEEKKTTTSSSQSILPSTPKVEKKEQLQTPLAPKEKKKVLSSAKEETKAKRKKVEKKVDKKSYPIQPNNNNLYKILLLLSFGVIIVLGYLFYRKHKRLQQLEDQELVFSEKINHLEKELSNYKQWLAYIAQELRTPVTTIVGLINVIQDTKLSKEQKVLLAEMDQDADYMICLLNDITDIANLQAGKIKLNNSEFNINHTIDYVYDIVSLKAKHKNTNILVQVDTNIPPKLFGDSVRLSQILINLLSNAIKYSQDADITFKVKKVDSIEKNVILEFMIADDNDGITIAEIQKLLHAYDSIDTQEVQKQGQTGLGLYIAKSLIELMNGKMEVKTTKGIGTVFSVTLSFRVKDEADKRLYRLPSKKMLGKNVLIIDSYNKSAIPLMQAFGYFRYKVSNISSLEYLRDKLKEERFDIIVINLFNITQNKIAQINAFQLGYNPKIVIYNELYNTMSHNLLDLKVDAFLKPPVTIQSVLDLITELYAPKKAPAIAQNPLREKLKKYNKKKILVVDDNELHHKVISNMLKKTGIEVYFVESGDAAIDLLQKGVRVDLILMDINMSVKDGFETALEIRKEKKFNHIPIIALTTDTSEATKKKILHSGMQAYLLKPIKLDKLYKTLLEYFSKKEFVIVTPEKKKRVETQEELEFSIKEGLSRCNNDEEMYKSLLKDFLKMYQHVAYDINKLCQEGEFQQARYKAMDVKDVALNLGAYKFAEAAAMVEYELEKGEKSNWKRHLKVLHTLLKKLFEDIKLYLQTQ